MILEMFVYLLDFFKAIQLLEARHVVSFKEIRAGNQLFPPVRIDELGVEHEVPDRSFGVLGVVLLHKPCDDLREEVVEGRVVVGDRYHFQDSPLFVAIYQHVHADHAGVCLRVVAGEHGAASNGLRFRRITRPHTLEQTFENRDVIRVVLQPSQRRKVGGRHGLDGRRVADEAGGESFQLGAERKVLVGREGTLRQRPTGREVVVQVQNRDHDVLQEFQIQARALGKILDILVSESGSGVARQACGFGAGFQVVHFEHDLRVKGLHVAQFEDETANVKQRLNIHFHHEGLLLDAWLCPVGVVSQRGVSQHPALLRGQQLIALKRAQEAVDERRQLHLTQKNISNKKRARAEEGSIDVSPGRFCAMSRRSWSLGGVAALEESDAGTF